MWVSAEAPNALALFDWSSVITAFKGNVFSCYRQAFVHLEGTYDVDAKVRAGQVNGLLGAAVPTLLFLTFGLSMGNVHLTVRIFETEPELTDEWEEVVEASFLMPSDKTLGLADWNGTLWEAVPLVPGSYRVRYSAINFGEGEEQFDEEQADEEADSPVERYELSFWPAEAAPDKIVKTTRPAAAYWHKVAQKTKA